MHVGLMSISIRPLATSYSWLSDVRVRLLGNVDDSSAFYFCVLYFLSVGSCIDININVSSGLLGNLG